jgi:O-antigen/teichoic acid export membrane protein
LTARDWLLGRASLATAIYSTVAVSALLASIVLARQLGPHGRGAVAVALLLPAVLELVLNAGLSPAIARAVAARPGDAGAVTGAALWLGLAAAVVGFLLAGGLHATGVLAALWPGLPGSHIALATAVFAPGLLGAQLKSVLLGLDRLADLTLATLFEGVLLVTATWAFVVVGATGIPGALAAHLVARSGGLAYVMRGLHREGTCLAPRLDWEMCRRLFSFGVPAQAANLLQFLTYRFDLLLVNLYLGAAAAGTYSAATALTELLWFLPNALSIVILPRVAQPRPGWTALIRNAVLASLVFMMSIAVPLGLLGDRLLVLVYSEAFRAGYIALMSLLPGTVLLGCGKLLANAVAGRGRPDWNAVGAGLSLVTLICLDVLLIPRLGLLGAGCAASAAYAVSFVSALVSYACLAQGDGHCR